MHNYTQKTTDQKKQQETLDVSLTHSLTFTQPLTQHHITNQTKPKRQPSPYPHQSSSCPTLLYFPLPPPLPFASPPFLTKLLIQPPHALALLILAPQHRFAALHLHVRRVDVEVRHVGVDVRLARGVFLTEAERRHGRAVAGEEGFGLGQSLGRGRHGRRVAEERVHVFQAHVGRFGVNEPDCAREEVLVRFGLDTFFRLEEVSDLLGGLFVKTYQQQKIQRRRKRAPNTTAT